MKILHLLIESLILAAGFKVIAWLIAVGFSPVLASTTFVLWSLLAGSRVFGYHLKQLWPREKTPEEIADQDKELLEDAEEYGKRKV